MLLYRVVPYAGDARPDEPGHPLFVDPARQGHGRADNPRHYAALYVSESAAGAVGEVFGDLIRWSSAMFEVPSFGARRALATFDVDPAPRVLDLDDARVLLDLGLRPTAVVSRDRELTQEAALTVWLRGEWEGLRWWSWWRPTWRNQTLWAPAAGARSWWWHERFAVTSIEPLTIDHPAVQVAADQLRRPLDPG
ncbi:MAG: RES domain-containing protein [Actinomycetota bacterium]